MVADSDCNDDDLDGARMGINEIYNHSYSHIGDEDYFGKGNNYRTKEIFMQNSQGLTVSSFLSYYRIGRCVESIRSQRFKETDGLPSPTEKDDGDEGADKQRLRN